MPLYDIAILTLIVGVFTTFAVVLAALSWYCRDTGRAAHRQGRRHHADYPSGGGLITDN